MQLYNGDICVYIYTNYIICMMFEPYYPIPGFQLIKKPIFLTQVGKPLIKLIAVLLKFLW